MLQEWSIHNFSGQPKKILFQFQNSDIITYMYTMSHFISEIEKKNHAYKLHHQIHTYLSPCIHIVMSLRRIYFWKQETSL